MSNNERDDSFLRDEGAMERAEWRAGTPRTEAEARVMLVDVEPEHAARERAASQMALGYVCVIVPVREWLVARGAERVQGWVGMPNWRPRPKRTPSGWAVSGGWLDDEVPPLPTPQRVNNSSGHRLVFAGATVMATGKWQVTLGPLGYEFAEWLRPPFHLAAGPYRVPRGWCRELAPIEETGPVVEPERTWETYRAAIAYLWDSRDSRRPSETQAFPDPRQRQ